MLLIPKRIYWCKSNIKESFIGNHLANRVENKIKKLSIALSLEEYLHSLSGEKSGGWLKRKNI